MKLELKQSVNRKINSYYFNDRLIFSAIFKAEIREKDKYFNISASKDKTLQI